MRLLFPVASLVLALTAGQASAEATLIDNGPVPLQGECAVNALKSDAHEGTSANLSTWACTGNAGSALDFSYTSGLTENCLYIDNISPDPKAFFVPMRTDTEWLAFKQATQAGGSLNGKVSLTYGCKADSTQTDLCGAGIDLPAARNGVSVTLETTPPENLATTYTCQAHNGCGLWVKTGEAGSCDPDPLPPAYTEVGIRCTLSAGYPQTLIVTLNGGATQSFELGSGEGAIKVFDTVFSPAPINLQVYHKGSIPNEQRYANVTANSMTLETEDGGEFENGLPYSDYNDTVCAFTW